MHPERQTVALERGRKGRFVSVPVRWLLRHLSVDCLQLLLDLRRNADDFARFQVEVGTYFPRRVVERVAEVPQVDPDPTCHRRLCP